MADYRILADRLYISNDTRATGLNNNDLIIGPTGAGKTRHYVKPNLLQCCESFIVTDTKGSLVDEVGPLMAKHGYRVLHINFKDLNGSFGYNPLDHIRWDAQRRKYNEQDVLTVAEAICVKATLKDPFWDQAAKLYLTAAISYVMDFLPKEEHNLKYVIDLIGEMGNGIFNDLMEEACLSRPDSLTAQSFKLFQDNHEASKMHYSIIGVLSEKLQGLNFDGAMHLFTSPQRLEFPALGQEKTVLFLTVSDTDRSMDRLVSLLYTQALQELVRYADESCPNHCLPVPIRFILDDFATNTFIPNFQSIISVIRSRGIAVSIILQSITQLDSLYGKADAQTIINNCDNCLYLGGQDVETAQFIAIKSNCTVDTVLNTPLHECRLFTRGQRPRKVTLFDLRNHPLYHELAEAQEPPMETSTAPIWGDDLCLNF